MTSTTLSGQEFQLFMRTAGGAISWRLLSANNRETGRGAIAYPDAELCRRAITDLQAHEADLVGRIRRTENNRWTWQIQLGDQLVATASRSADRMIRAEGALAAFRASIAQAVIRPTIVMTEARRWRTAAR